MSKETPTPSSGSGFINGLTDDQREGALSFSGDDTHPASGSDGLEAVAYRVRHPRHEAYRLCFVHGPLDSAEPLVTREAAEKRIGEAEAQSQLLRTMFDDMNARALAAESLVAALKAALEQRSGEGLTFRERGFVGPELTLYGDHAKRVYAVILALKEGR